MAPPCHGLKRQPARRKEINPKKEGILSLLKCKGVFAPGSCNVSRYALLYCLLRVDYLVIEHPRP